MHGMKTFCTWLLLCAAMTALVMLAMFYSVHNAVYIAWLVGAVVVFLASLYGQGYFSGWLSGHEEKHSYYRHDTGE